MNVKTASTRTLTVLAAAAFLSAPVVITWAAPGAADSIGSVYNMDRMLAEPHPLADQYGTRWQPQPPQPPPSATAPAYAPVLAPGAIPSPFLSPQPGTAPEPPPTTFAPPEPPTLGQTAPPQPAPQPAPPLVMTPRLSIDAEGVDLEPEKMEKDVSEEAGPEKRFEQPGPRPPLPPG